MKNDLQNGKATTTRMLDAEAVKDNLGMLKDVMRGLVVAGAIIQKPVVVKAGGHDAIILGIRFADKDLTITETANGITFVFDGEEI